MVQEYKSPHYNLVAPEDPEQDVDEKSGTKVGFREILLLVACLVVVFTLFKLASGGLVLAENSVGNSALGNCWSDEWGTAMGVLLTNRNWDENAFQTCRSEWFDYQDTPQSLSMEAKACSCLKLLPADNDVEYGNLLQCELGEHYGDMNLHEAVVICKEDEDMNIGAIPFLPSTPSDTDESLIGCLEAFDTVTTLNGETRAKDVKIGDFVESCDGEWIRVWDVPHGRNNIYRIRKDELVDVEFYKFTFSNEKTISLTSDHFLPICDPETKLNSKHKLAMDVNVGDMNCVGDELNVIENIEIVLGQIVNIVTIKDLHFKVNGVCATYISDGFEFGFHVYDFAHPLGVFEDLLPEVYFTHVWPHIVQYFNLPWLPSSFRFLQVFLAVVSFPVVLMFYILVAYFGYSYMFAKKLD